MIRFPHNRCLLLLLPVVFTVLTSDPAQSQELVTDYKINGGQDVETVLPQEIQYLRPRFEQATLIDCHGNKMTGIINIHILTQYPRMLNTAGDTTGIADIGEIVRIIFPDSTTVIPAGGKWVTVLAEKDDVTISELASITLESPDGIRPPDPEISKGGNQLTWLTGAKTTVNYSRYGASHPKRVIPGNEFTLRCIFRTEYVLTQNGKIYPCKLKSFLKLFPSNKKAIREYAQNNYIYFNERESILALFRFCTSDTAEQNSLSSGQSQLSSATNSPGAD